MINLNSKDLLVNIKHRPGPDSREYKDFWENERKKCMEGVRIGDWECSPWLYWHLNLWSIYIDHELPNGDIVPRLANPQLRDNEIIISEYLAEAERKPKKGVIIFGSRRITKSVVESSYSMHKATFWKGGQNVISGLSEADIRVITKYCEIGLTNLPPYFKHARLDDNWNKEVTFGYKEQETNERKIWSSILVRNFDGGKNTEAAAGITAFSFILDEVGKGDMSKAFAAAKPTFDSPMGWRCSPILSGTGGDIEKSKDAKEFFDNPEAHNFLGVHMDGYKKKKGLFLSGLYSLKVPKDEKTLGDYLGSDDEELQKIPILVTNRELGLEIITRDREQAATSDDPSTLLKEKMYYPLNIEEMFLMESDNNFPVEACRQQLEYIERNQIEPANVELYRDIDGKIKHKFSSKKPVTDFPVTKNTNKDAPIQVWDFPNTNSGEWVYIAGADPYNQSSSVYSDSLGVVYIYKRMMDISGDSYIDSPVACYAARPSDMNTWHENVEMLLEWYNAICFPENEASTFIQWFNMRNKMHLLADGLNFLREVSPNSKTGTRVKGVAATPKIIAHCMSLTVEYTKEVIQTTELEDGTPAGILGVSRIYDKMLLREMIEYNSKEGNFDRVVAFRHVVAYDRFLAKYGSSSRVNYAETDANSYRVVKSPFSSPHKSVKGTPFF